MEVKIRTKIQEISLFNCLSRDPVAGLIVIRVRSCGESLAFGRIGGGDCQSSTWQWCRSFCSEYKIRSVPRRGRSDLEEHTALRK